MGIVKALAAEVYSKIAAGEVVERPLSVVKELVENSLDAQARSVRIELEEGGKRLIRIRDDGTGFFPEDILPAFSRHSTSKLVRLEDFDRLESLGFRGEALPSIAEVSRITLISSTGHSGLGVSVALEGQQEINRQETACPKGTEISVADLFYNFPVRRRFLKSERTELNAILRYIEQLSLAYWSVSFTLHHNGRELFSFPAVQSLQERIYQVFGKEFLEGLLIVETEAIQGWRMSGWVSKPGRGGRDRQRQFFFVNGRNIREKTLMAAFNQAYSGCLEKEHQPQGVLLLAVPAHEIDVNIHPMKLEIKFADNQKLFSWVFRSLTAVIKGKTVMPGLVAERHGVFNTGEIQAHNPDYEKTPSGFGFNTLTESSMQADPGSLVAQADGYRLLGQFQNSYIVVEKKAELLLVDQHNAHETVIYNRLNRQISQQGGIATAATLFPILCELSPREWAQFEDKREDLQKLGFELEPLGVRSLSIRAYPAELADAQCREALLALLNEETTDDRARTPGRLATIACKSAIKVNHPLHELEMKRLLDDYFALEQRDYCPHGRPITVRLDMEEIEKRLKRR